MVGAGQSPKMAFGKAGAQVFGLAPPPTLRPSPISSALVPIRSPALPFAPFPAVLAADLKSPRPLAGNAGFDPLGLASSTARLNLMRDAEVKHARLAMVASVGWPAAELLDERAAAFLGLPSVLGQTGGLNPSLLNGGLFTAVSPYFWVRRRASLVRPFPGPRLWRGCSPLALLAVQVLSPFPVTQLLTSALSLSLRWWNSHTQVLVLAGTAQVETAGAEARRAYARSAGDGEGREPYVAGDLGFDPLELYPPRQGGAVGSVEARRAREASELKHGRLAMLAVVAYALEEAASRQPVVGGLAALFIR